MTSKLIAMALLSTALMTGITSAQTSTTTPADRTNNSATEHNDRLWRSSKLVGLDVYNGANEKIGSIQDIILDKSGRVVNVILGVGGFLGLDEHYVSVGFDKLKWVNEPVRTSTTAPAGSSTTTVGANDGRTASPARTLDEKWYPDHVVMDATKDQLRAMPQFKYN
jgi:sporulation protein YlmC with PRC-barrel domain